MIKKFDVPYLLQITGLNGTNASEQSIKSINREELNLKINIKINNTT